MANTFKNAKAVLKDSTTSPSGVTVYTCPSATVAVVVGAQIANVDNLAVGASLWWVDSSDSNAVTRLIENVSIPALAALSPIAGKLILESGDYLVGQSEIDDELEITVSVLEIS